MWLRYCPAQEQEPRKSLVATPEVFVDGVDAVEQCRFVHPARRALNCGMKLIMCNVHLIYNPVLHMGVSLRLNVADYRSKTHVLPMQCHSNLILR